MRLLLARAAASAYILAMVCFLPLMAAIVFANREFVLNYSETFRKALRHIRAMHQGPALHYFHDVLGRVSRVPETIQGECIQCGNCCMNHQCMFLQQVGVTQFQCGIYNSPFRRLSNCGSFPLNGYDIERYACPSYSVVPAGHQVVPQVVYWVPQLPAENLVSMRTEKQKKA